MQRRTWLWTALAALFAPRVTVTAAPPARTPWPPAPVTDEQLADGGFLVHEDFVDELRERVAAAMAEEQDRLIYGTGAREPIGIRAAARYGRYPTAAEVEASDDA